MTLNELKEKVAESPHKEWYQQYEILINYSHVNFNASLKGVPAIYEFVLKQIEGYSKYSSLPEELNRIKERFVTTKRNILQLVINNNISSNQWNDNLRNITNNSPLVFLNDLPETAFLIKVHQEKPEYYNGAYEYFTGPLQHANNKLYFNGYMLAYEFVSKDFSLLAERKEAEEKSISSIRSDFQKKLGEAETQMTEYLAQANDKFLEYSKIIDELKRQKEGLYSQWFEETSKSFNDFNKNSAQKIKDFEDLYKAKLKLEAPAKYWSDRARKLRKEGYWWLGALMACIGVGVCVLIWILNRLADGAYVNIFSETAIAIKWSVALVTLISFLAFGIRTFSKLTFSSFHLVRDAEEREQLTYVYLALQKEKGIDQTERHLIMQSLFSRADSGLLKDDASPTMPGNIVDQMTKK